jgi:riboflavin biosynthesis pyrimidine reductase
MANMVMSVDGAFSLEGRSAGLAGPVDRELFHTLRAAADAILVAAGTARQERYRRPSTLPELRAGRTAAGLAEVPRLVLVSRSVLIPEDQPFLTGEGPDPLLLHPVGADTSAVPVGVELRALGEHGVDLRAGLQSLRDDGIEQLMCEGGPNLLGQMHAADLLDELFVTLSPQLVGGDRRGLLGDVAAHPRPFTLHRVLEADGFLFLTYRRAAAPPDGGF